MISLINRIISDILEYGAPTTKRKWAKRLEEWGYANKDLAPFHSDKYQEQIITMQDGMILVRMFETHDGETQEMFRIFFDDNKVYTFKYKAIGTSRIYAFQPAQRQMGYDEAEQPKRWKSHIIDQVGLYPYMPYEKADLNAYELVLRGERFANGIEILIKQGFKKFAEIICNKMPHVDVETIMKHNRKLMEKPSENKVEFANNVKAPYERGMLGVSYYHLNRCLEEVSWKFLKQYAKSHDVTVSQMVIDYSDYLGRRKNHKMVQKPKDLYSEKEKLRRLEEKAKVKKDKKQNKKYDRKINKRSLPTVTTEDYIIAPFKSTDELHEEGSEMRHCVYDYREKYADGRKDLYSVRTHDNERIATVEVNPMDGNVFQCRGKYNKDLESKLRKELDKLKAHYNKEDTCS